MAPVLGRKAPPPLFPLARLPFDLLEQVVSFAISHEDGRTKGVSLLFVNRKFANAAVTHVWRHVYVGEPSVTHLEQVLMAPVNTYDYAEMIRSVTVCPVSISRMRVGGVLRLLEFVNLHIPEVQELRVEDRLSFCHVCHVGNEASPAELAPLLTPPTLTSLAIDSEHCAFGDELLELMGPHLSGVRQLALSGSNFSDSGMIDLIIPHVRDNLEEFRAGRGSANLISFGGRTVIELLDRCPKLRRMELEGMQLLDDDFNPVLHPDSTLDAILSSSPDSYLPEGRLEYLRLGKAHKGFTSFGLRALLSTSHTALRTLVLDLEHVSREVLEDIIVPMFHHQRLEQLDLVSEELSEWLRYYPTPRYEYEAQAKKAMWHWRLKEYLGLSWDVFAMVGRGIPSLRVFNVLGHNILASDSTVW